MSEKTKLQKNRPIGTEISLQRAAPSRPSIPSEKQDCPTFSRLSRNQKSKWTLVLAKVGFIDLRTLLNRWDNIRGLK